MADDLVLSALRSSMMPAFPDDETRLDNMRSAADELADAFAGDLGPAVPEAVWAFCRRDVASSAAVIQTAGKVLEQHWPTVHAATSATPVEFLRVVLAEALSRACARQDGERAGSIATAAWYAMRTVNETGVDGGWEVVARQFTTQVAASIEPVLARLWTWPESEGPLRMPSVKDSVTKVVNQSAAQTALEEAFRAAATNQPNQVANALADHVAEPLAKWLAQVSQIASNNSAAVSGELQRAITETGSRVRAALENRMLTVEVSNRHTRALWWRFGDWSDTAQRPYSELGTSDLIVASAADLVALMPDLMPPVIEHQLRLLVLEKVGSEASVDLSDLSASIEALLPGLLDDAPASGCSLLNAIQNADADGAAPIQSSLPWHSDELAAERGAVLLLRELASHRALSGERR